MASSAASRHGDGPTEVVSCPVVREGTYLPTFGKKP